MRENTERIKQIKIENFIWVICLILIGISIYGNIYEEKYFKYYLQEDKEKYRKALIFVFSAAMIIYIYYLYDSYKSYLDNKNSLNKKSKDLATLNLYSSFLFTIAGAILLYIAISDENLDTEISFT